MAVMGAGLSIGIPIKFVLTHETGRNWLKRLAKDQGGRVSEIQIREMHAALSGGAAGAIQGYTSREQ
jgi:hypothetical protein